MNDLTATDLPSAWRKPVRGMQRMVSAGWFWHLFARCLGASAGVTGVLWWLLRVQDVSPAPAWLLGGGCLTVGLLAAWDWSRDHRMSLRQAVVRLDLGWQYSQRLVSASEGHASWPDRVPDRSLPLSWKLQPCLPPLVFSLLFLLMGAGLPLPPERPASFQANTEPPDWQALESMASFLEEEEMIQEQDADRIRRDVDQLRANPASEWYEPASLEATDLLRERVQADARRLEQGLAQTARLIAAAAERREQLNQQQLQQLMDQMRELERRMQAGDLQPREDLRRQLEALNADALQQMDQQALQQLREQLEQNREALMQALAEAGLDGRMGGENGGAGGVNRGGGPSDLTLQGFESHEQAQVPMTLPETQPERMQMGDLLRIREGEHDNERPEISTQGGDLQSPGGGGEMIWRDDLLPEDANVLQDYFK